MAIYQPPSPGLKRYFEQHSFSDRVREGGLGYLLNRWTRIVAEVETGYRRVIYE